MILTLRPVGRGNWRLLTIVVHGPAGLFPLVRSDSGVVTVGEKWFMSERWWRVVEVSP